LTILDTFIGYGVWWDVKPYSIKESINRYKKQKHSVRQKVKSKAVCRQVCHHRYCTRSYILPNILRGSHSDPHSHSHSQFIFILPLL